MKKIEAVIFDWAGTTVDFGSCAPVEAFIHAFKQFGITPTLAEVREPMGVLKWKHIEAMLQMPRIAAEWERLYGKAVTKEDVDAVYAKSESGILEILHNFAEPKAHVLEAIETLRSRGIKIGSTTGYTDEMMAIVAPKAEENGYKPDFWCSANAVGNMGRPYPYMIFKNMEALNISAVSNVLKVGDTIADIKEGQTAGVRTVGILEGSSLMGLTQDEYNALSIEEKETQLAKTKAAYLEAGADFTIVHMGELPALIQSLEA